MIIQILSLILLFYLIPWRLFQKANKQGWLSLIPVVNDFVLSDISHKKWTFWVRFLTLILAIVIIITCLITGVAQLSNLNDSTLNELKSLFGQILETDSFESSYDLGYNLGATIAQYEESQNKALLDALKSIIGYVATISITIGLSVLIILVTKIYTYIGLVKAFNKPVGLVIGLCLINPLFMAYLAFSDDVKYENYEYSQPIDNVFWCIVISIGLMIYTELVMPLSILPAVMNLNPVFNTFLGYFAFISYWIMFILVMKFIHQDKPILSTLWTKVKENNWKYLLLGIAIGFLMNGADILAAFINKDVELSFAHFQPIFLMVIFAAVFVQSSAEEMICRGYLYQKIRKASAKPWVAIIGNSVMFGILHLGNPNVTPLAIFDIFLTGLFYSLVIYYFNSMWFVMGHHAMWNFTQNIIFGLPNSGLLSDYSMFTLNTETAKNSLFYNTGFGIEGTIGSVLIMTLACVITYLLGRKYKHQEFVPEYSK